MPSPPKPLEPPPAPGSFLWPDHVIEELTDLEKKGLYTAERCPEQTRQAIVKLTIDGWPNIQIANTLRVAQGTVAAVQDHPDYAKAIDEGKQGMAKKLRRVNHSLIDRVVAHPDLIPFQSIPIAVKMFHEVAESLEGKPALRIEHSHRVDIYSDWPDVLANLEKEANAQVVSTGLVAGNVPLIQDQAADPAAGDPDRTIDPESEVSTTEPQVDPDHVTSFIPDPGPETTAEPAEIQTLGEAQETPRGGVAPRQQPGSASTDNHGQKF